MWNGLEVERFGALVARAVERRAGAVATSVLGQAHARIYWCAHHARWQPMTSSSGHRRLGSCKNQNLQVHTGLFWTW